MTLKRAQGRPPRGVDDVGREKLLQGARVVFRSKLASYVSRKDVARAAGVTPALVSYYFADKGRLVLAATQPILEAYAEAALDILDLDAPHLERLEKIVALSLRFSAEEGGVLDTYFAHAHEFDPNPLSSLIPDVWERLTTFMADGASAGAWRDVEPGLLLFSIWGMCKAVAESPTVPTQIFDDLADDMLRRSQTRFILGLVCDGIRLRQV